MSLDNVILLLKTVPKRHSVAGVARERLWRVEFFPHLAEGDAPVPVAGPEVGSVAQRARGLPVAEREDEEEALAAALREGEVGCAGVQGAHVEDDGVACLEDSMSGALSDKRSETRRRC